MQQLKREEETFKPMGDKLHEYTVKSTSSSESTVYEIYKCNFQNPQFKSYHRRLQTFLLFFIEGASYIDEDDEFWEIYVVFEKRRTAEGKERFAVVGYATVYPFFCWPDRRRLRISQFLILPPFQKKGHGRELYKSLYAYFLSRPEVSDFSVEDPNDPFQNLRDACDLQTLLDSKIFDGIQAPVDPALLLETRQKFKLSKGQVERCCEMALLKALPPQKGKKAAGTMDNVESLWKAYRLQVKRRLYRHNEEVLAGMEEKEWKQKLQETYEVVVEGYRQVLGMIV
ncbi:histone acetyltransferase 1 [Chytridiales sp. JEL 0842]|nr:histone acetyltransferase 1 [Chytridiales sp. JEL 0842]